MIADIILNLSRISLQQISFMQLGRITELNEIYEAHNHNWRLYRFHIYSIGISV